MNAAERQRQWRKRHKRHEMVVSVVVSRNTRDVLSECGWIGEWDEDNRKVVQEAVQRLIDEAQPVRNT